MIINERIISLKDGRACLLRTPEERDAGQLLAYLQVMSTETIYILNYPEEVIVNQEEEINFIKNIRESANKFMIAAFVGDELAGTAQINIHTKIKTKHRADLGIGLLQKFCGLGLGSSCAAATWYRLCLAVWWCCPGCGPCHGCTQCHCNCTGRLPVWCC